MLQNTQAPNPAQSRYRSKYPLQKRKLDYEKLHNQYRKLPQTFILVKIEPSPLSKAFSSVKTMTLLLGHSMKVADIQLEIKKKLQSLLGNAMKPNLSLNIFCNNRMLQPNRVFSEMADKLKDEDGFIYINYAEMDSF